MEILEILAKKISDRYRLISTGWVMIPCPLAEYSHSDGDDKHFSFGISATGGFHCFTCGIKGHVTQLPRMLAKYHKSYSYDLEDIIREFVENIPENGNGLYSSSENGDSNGLYIPIEVFENYPDATPCMGLTAKDIRKWKIKMIGDTLIFPIFNSDQTKLIGLKCRKKNTRFFWYIGEPSKREGIWFGMWFTPEKHLALVEGERDAILLSRAVTTWASLGSPTESQVETIASLPRDISIILAFDNDRAGQDICNFVYEFLFDRRLYRLELGDHKDPAELIECGHRNLKFKRVN